MEGDTPLFSSGIIDSLNVIELVSLVEKKIKKNIPPKDILLENFDTVDDIIAYIKNIP